MKLRFPTDDDYRAEDIDGVDIVSFRDFYAFEQHVKTCRALRGAPMLKEWYAQPVFYFSNHFALVHDGQEVPVPIGSNRLDFELEIGVVIGKAGRNIPVDQAWEHVLGFTIVNDLSARDLQKAEMRVGLGPSKGKDFATAVGPQLVPMKQLQDRIRDGRIDSPMRAYVNDTLLSEGNASTMYFSWPEIIAHASRNVTLQPGELLGSGTVGTGCILELQPENTGGWLKPGDVVRLEVDPLGSLTNTISESEHV